MNACSYQIGMQCEQTDRKYEASSSDRRIAVSTYLDGRGLKASEPDSPFSRVCSIRFSSATISICLAGSGSCTAFRQSSRHARRCFVVIGILISW